MRHLLPAIASILLCVSAFRSPAAESGDEGKVAALIQRLQSPSATLRIPAAEDLGKLGPSARAAVPALIRALGDSEVVVRNHAAWSLGKIKDPADEIVPALFGRLEAENEQWTVRHNAALSLSWIGQPAVATLQRGLQAKLEWTQGYSVDALIRIGVSGAVRGAVERTIARLLVSQDAAVRAFVAKIAASLPDPPAEVVPLVAALLRDPSLDVRRSAVQTLAVFGRKASPAIPQLIAVMKDDAEQWVRIGAALALGEIREATPEAVAALIAAFADSRDRVGGNAAEALSKLGAPAVPALIDALASPKKAIRMGAADALAFMGAAAGDRAPSAAEALVPLLLKDPEWEVRFRAATALGLLGVKSEAVLAALREAAADPNDTVRLNVTGAQERLGQVPTKSKK